MNILQLESSLMQKAILYLAIEAVPTLQLGVSFQIQSIPFLNPVIAVFFYGLSLGKRMKAKNNRVADSPCCYIS